MYPAIRGSAREDGGRVWRPGELEDFVGVAFEGVKSVGEGASVPEPDCLCDDYVRMSTWARENGVEGTYLVAGACDEEIVVAWAEGDGENLAVVCHDALFWGCTRGVACIPATNRIRRK